MFVEDETGRLLEEAAAELNGADPDDDDPRLVALVRRQFDKARHVPPDLAAELARAASVGQEAWIVAREQSDFESFAPYLERNFELARSYVDCHMDSRQFECPYDALLDDYEPELPTREVSALFAQLKAELMPVIARIADAEAVDEAPLYAAFPVDRQRDLVRDVVGLMGFDDTGWRIDDTVHPFATRIGGGDVRITTRWDEHFFPTGCTARCTSAGTGCTKRGCRIGCAARPSAPPSHWGCTSPRAACGRTWSAAGGRSARCSPPDRCAGRRELADLDADGLYRAVNRVKPSFIRVEADEATYALHIILRFELEQELIEGTLAVRDLPEAWNARFEEYFGITVPTTPMACSRTCTGRPG